MTGNIQFLQNKQELWKRTSNFPNEENTRKKKNIAQWAKQQNR